ncbi:MAG: cytochrome c [candidate division Zixibacteria bacterium]|nr:cytochrome c [candidate division Zixibacteria bacterium]
MKYAKSAGSLAALFLFMAALSCSKTKSSTELEYMPDMARTPAVKAQQVRTDDSAYTSLRLPPAGTIPLDYDPYPYDRVDTVGPAMNLVNPLPTNMEVLETGRKYFNNYCIVCHGPTGDGKGYIVPRFPEPPSLLTEKIMNWEDGRIFHMITAGRGNMPAYAAQLQPMQRWAIVHYVRALIRAAHPTPQDLTYMKENNLELLFYKDRPDTVSQKLWPAK